MTDEEFRQVMEAYFVQQKAVLPDDKEIGEMLGAMTRHEEATRYIKSQVHSYEKSFYHLAKAVAEKEGETHIITKSHAERAKLMLNQRKQGLDWSDACLGIGGLLAGVAVTHLFDLGDGTQKTARISLIIAGLVGMLLMGIGITLKATK